MLERIDQKMNEESQIPEQNIDWTNIQILTVEDNPVNQFVIESTIKSWNGETDIASNGQEALNMLGAKIYDIILMDMQMPIMDGITTTKVIRQEIKSDIPIIAFTANALQREKNRCLAIGMNDYVSKPFEEATLKSKMIKLLKASKPELATSPTIIKPLKPLFQLNKLNEISRGNESFIKKMLAIFCTDSKLQLEQMNQTNEADEIASLAHKIKPSIDYISNDTMKKLVRRIEQKDFIETPSLLTDFTTKLQELIDLAAKELK